MTDTQEYTWRRLLFKMVLTLTGIVLVITAGGAGLTRTAAAQAGSMALALANGDTVSGWLSVIWPDGKTGSPRATTPTYVIFGEQNKATYLAAGSLALRSKDSILSFDRKRVTAQGRLQSLGLDQGGAAIMEADAIALDGSSTVAALPEAVTGSKPWISILCKFSDVAAQPQALSYFQTMLDGAFPHLDHFWREQSYGQANIAGSSAAGWYTLPRPRSGYVTASGLNHGLAARDCTAAADPYVNFRNYVGVNLMFNDDLDGYAWGGTWWLNLDGENKLWYMTWEPPWGYENIAAIAHEMGHGFGLPHSSGTYGDVYDNVWDVMSGVWSYCDLLSNPIYGCIGQGTISYHKDKLGWIAPAQRYVLAANSAASITLERLALPQSNNYLIAQIAIAGTSTRFYTVEARKQAGYDVRVPFNGVVIHDVDLTRGEPAHIIDADNNGNVGDQGSVFTVGETFSDAANKVYVQVLSATATGYTVSIRSGQPAASTATATAAPAATSTQTPTVPLSPTRTATPPAPTATATPQPPTRTATTPPAPTATATPQPATRTATPQLPPSPTSTPPTVALDYLLRVNAGGPAYTDAQGRAWSPDQAFVEGAWGYVNGTDGATTSAISNTADSALYQSERHWPVGANAVYKFVVPNGLYQVTLKFADPVYGTPGLRQFSINIAWVIVSPAFDIAAASGGKNTAVDKTFSTAVTDNLLKIILTQVSGEPMVSAIEIRGIAPLPTATATATTPASTATSTATVTPTNTPAATATATATAERTSTPTITSTSTATKAAATATLTPTRVNTSTPTVAATQTATVAATKTATPAPTNTHTQTPPATQTAAPTATTSPTVPPTPSPTNTFTTVVASPTPGAGTTDFLYVKRVNAGGSVYFDTLGDFWEADRMFSPDGWGYRDGYSAATTANIANTNDDPLFRADHRWYGTADPGYSFTVPNGRYDVTMRFTEQNQFRIGGRLFGINIEGTTVLANFDIFRSAGGAYLAVDRVFTVNVDDGVLDISFVKNVAKPKVDAIRIQQLP